MLVSSQENLVNEQLKRHKMIYEIVAAHKDDADNQGQLDKINVYFKETIVDSEPGSLDVIEASPICTMVKPHNFVFGAPGPSNN